MADNASFDMRVATSEHVADRAARSEISWPQMLPIRVILPLSFYPLIPRSFPDHRSSGLNLNPIRMREHFKRIAARDGGDGHAAFLGSS